MILIKNKAEALLLKELLNKNDFSSEFTIIDSLKGRYLNSADIIFAIIHLKESGYLEIKKEDIEMFKLNITGKNYAYEFIDDAKNKLHDLISDLDNVKVATEETLNSSILSNHNEVDELVKDNKEELVK